MILKAYAERGLASIVEPVSGYLILATKLISLSAFQLSIEWAPEIALALTVAHTCDGISSKMWHVWLTGQQCRDMIARSLIRR